MSLLKHIQPVILLFAVLLFLISCSEEKNRSILIFTTPINKEAVGALQAMISAKEIKVDTTTNINYLTEDSLKNFGAILLFNTTQDLLDVKQQNDIERYVQAGGAIVGVHADGYSQYQWPWFNSLLGATINKSSDSAASSNYTVKIKEEHLTTQDLPSTWVQRDDIKRVSTTSPEINIVASINDQPLSWYHEYEGGRIFYTAAGGTLESLKNENFKTHLLAGIEYSLKGKALNYHNVKTRRLPEENRFLQLVLDSYLDEPIEMEILDQGRVLFIERHGNIKIYDPAKKASKTIAKLAVQLEGNYEDGLLGLELDPDFKTNHYIYLYYSPLGGKPVQKLSRFVMKNDSLILSSEKLVLEVPVQRETCCHSAGNVYFAPDGNLYLSTGDNTSSKESDGFTPIDERPGRAPFDAQKSSGNTHDLRGKILRIHVEKDGSYTIPDGNLFPKDGSKGRPEIYVMGARNPYRITVDQRGFLYWGDVGPDGGQESERGPKSHDEWNQARKPGNFGWPYFVGDNKAYADFDFATNVVGEKFNPENPTNESPYNYGSKLLPPAQNAMIWYSYNQSEEFPMLRTGSRSAMAGPFYYEDDYQNSNTKFPSYYNNKMFIFEWARSWIKVLTFTKDGDLKQIESFLPELEFHHPIDIKFGPDGAMYVLQYGANYFARNPDAQLVRIEYAEGNRQPVAQISAEKIVGAAPLTVKLSAKKSFDYDANTNLQYSWSSGDGKTAKDIETTFTYTRTGVFRPTLTVTDESGSSASTEVEIKVGNETPVVSITINGNRSFYFNNSTIDYKVNVQDTEDGASGKTIDDNDIKFSIDYLAEGKDLALLSSNANSGVDAKFIQGKTLMDGSDCKSCHAMTEKSIGPSLVDISNRYKENTSVVSMLSQKIINGGNGNWGKTMMAAHPQLTEAQSTQMVNYILSLDNKQKSLPLQGSYNFKEHAAKEETGSYIITASYTDKGHEVTGALTGRQMIVLRNPRVQAEDFDSFHKVGQQRPVGKALVYVSDIKEGSYISFHNIDITGIKELAFNVQATEGRIEVHQDSPAGKLIGTADLSTKAKESPWRIVTTKIDGTAAQHPHDLFFVFYSDQTKNRNFANLDWIEFKK